jgi:hypothetical protein
MVALGNRKDISAALIRWQRPCIAEHLENRVLLSTTVAVPDGNPVTIALTNKANDSISVTLTLTTTDTNEDGEGEALLLQSSDGFSASVTQYNHPVLETFKATADNDTLTATLSGDDDDETGVVTADVNPSHWFSDATKHNLGIATAALGLTATTAGSIAAVSALAPEPLVSKAVAAASVITSVVTGSLAGVTGLISAVDPADPNFKTVVKPDFATLPLLRSSKQVPPKVAGALNTLDLNGTKLNATLNAAYTSSNRADGAMVAGSKKFLKVQEGAISRYDKLAATLLSKEVILLENANRVLTAAGVNVSVSSSDVLSFEASVQSNGLPSEFLADMQKLGVSQATISTIQSTMFAQDTSAAAGSFPACLVDPTLLSDLKSAAASLKKG